MVQKAVVMSALFAMMGVCSAACNEDSDGKDKKDNGRDRDTGSETEDAGGPEDETDDTDTSVDEITVTLNIPETFDGTPELLGAMFYADSEMAGMPDALGTFLSAPEIVAGEDFELVTTQANLDGEYYLAVTLYCKNGGGGQFPVTGVDWIGGVGEPLTLGPGTGMVDAGEITLFLMEK